MNLGENNNFFRESFRGFNKDDVAEYIAKLSNDYDVNVERYKEHIAKLTLELKAKTDEINNYAPAMEDRTGQLNQFERFDEIQQNHREEISRLVEELNEKDAIISNLQGRLELDGDPSADILNSDEIVKYQELISNLSREIEQLKEESDKSESYQTDRPEQSGPYDQFDLSESVNQLSFQLAECESEKLFLFNLIKKFIYALDIESARDKDIEYAANISDIAPKTVIAEEIDSGLRSLVESKEKTAELESENAELKTKAEENQTAVSDEQKIYESITADLGGIIYSAKKSAEEINAKATAEAEDIIGRATAEAEAIIGSSYERKEAVLKENVRNMAEFREKFGFIKTEYEEMIQKYKEISENYALHLSEIEGTLGIIYDYTAEQSADNKITDI